MNKQTEKQLKCRNDNLKYDFLPSMLEIIEKPANKICNIIMYTIFSLIIVSIIWACTTRIDVAVTASGIVDSTKPTVNINSISSGTIKDVKVYDGDYVNKGDVICTLESDVDESNLREYEHNLELLRLQKEIYGCVYNNYKNDEYVYIDKDLELYGENSKYAEAIILENNVFVDGIKTIYGEQLKSEKDKRLLYVIQNINEIDEKIQRISAEKTVAEKELNDKTIVAVESGVYSSNNKIYTGKNISSGENIGNISVVDKEYRFVAYVCDEDVAMLSEGDIVNVKLAAYNDSSFDTLEGKIVRINDVPVNIEGKGNVYIVDIYFDSYPDNIKSGMEGNVDIIIGTRTVMDYFLEPFITGLKGSLKER